ncbi:MAG: hypothetical protein AVDCRST_MAG93-1678 [uncultured Chloroflexia bacterium]|uniref:Uncharacterized protein n=1 Tax=uncultured Chloroflexia bacterium TaxID=1672391 RepID=A0A6J4IG68_9CHLR|nr:MAG: hypothetical protein AVDCRST_MAG93-1678 [uncultured Chloroflexia bacterium]
MVRMIKGAEESYDAHEVPYSKVYVWPPGHIAVAWCGCSGEV